MAKFISVSEYAKQNEINTAAVYLRHKRGRLKMVKKNGIWLVNVDSYKPGKPGRPTKKAKNGNRKV